MEDYKLKRANYINIVSKKRKKEILEGASNQTTI